MRWPELRPAEVRDVPALLERINDHARRGLLLPRTEESLRARVGDFVVAVRKAGAGDEIVGGGALTALSPGVGEVRSLTVRDDVAGQGLGRRLVEHLLAQARFRGFVEVLALTRRVSFFAGLGFVVTRRERFLDKLITDCQACPFNLCCDEVAMVREAPEDGASDGSASSDGSIPHSAFSYHLETR